MYGHMTQTPRLYKDAEIHVGCFTSLCTKGGETLPIIIIIIIIIITILQVHCPHSDQ